MAYIAEVAIAGKNVFNGFFLIQNGTFYLHHAAELIIAAFEHIYKNGFIGVKSVVVYRPYAQHGFAGTGSYNYTAKRTDKMK